MRYLRLFLLSALLVPAVAPAMGRAPRRFSVILVPAHHHLVQLGRDVADQEDALLMTYAPMAAADAPFLHAWTGENWVRVRAEAFDDGSFLRVRADRVLVIGSPGERTRRLIESAADWCPEVLNLGSERVTDLINGMGRLFEFDRRDWEWYAARYELQLEDLNKDVRDRSWYDSYRASELPPPSKPWQRKREDTVAPRTSLSPISVQAMPAEEGGEEPGGAGIESEPLAPSGEGDVSLEPEEAPADSESAPVASGGGE